jgi:hypothetical protein
MKLSVLDRLVLLSSLPKEGSLATIKILHDLKMTAGFSEVENKKLNFRNAPNGDLLWDDKVPEKDVPIGELGIKIIKESLAALDKAGKLTENFLPLIEKIGYVEEKSA